MPQRIKAARLAVPYLSEVTPAIVQPHEGISSDCSGSVRRLDRISSQEGAAGNGITEKRNVPLAITTFVPAKSHEVKAHWRLAHFRLKVVPFVAQSFDHSTTTFGMKLVVFTTWPAFSRAQVVITADGKALASSMEDWIIDGLGFSETEQTNIVDSRGLIRKMIAGKDVYLTVLIPGTAPPFDQMNFKLSPEQLTDCQLLADKYDVLKSGSLSHL